MVNRKNFNATVYTGDITKGFQGKISYHSQHNYDNFMKFVASKFSHWTRVNLYDKKTKECESIVNTEIIEK